MTEEHQRTETISRWERREREGGPQKGPCKVQAGRETVSWAATCNKTFGCLLSIGRRQSLAKGGLPAAR